MPKIRYPDSEVINLNGTSSLNLSQFERFFSSLRDFINQKGPYLSQLSTHIDNATQKLVKNSDLLSVGDDSFIIVLKSFINSRDTIDKIDKHRKMYINLRKVLSSNEVVQAICPNGYYQWQKFWNKIGESYHRQKIDRGLGNIDEEFSILDFEDCCIMDGMKDRIISDLENRE